MGRTISKTEDAAFDQFWAVYPNHAGKLAAQRKWKVLNPAPELVTRIMAALEWQCRLPGWQDPEFIPHAKTYLHNARWEDEPPKRNGNGKGHIPVFTEWACPHMETHTSKYYCDQATHLNKPRKVPA